MSSAWKRSRRLLQAYFPKKPLNFGQHNFTNGCPRAQTEARYPTRTYIKDFPSGFFSQKNVKIARSHSFCLGISTFFRGVPPKGDAAQRQICFGLFTRVCADFNEIERGFLWQNRWLELPTIHTHMHTCTHMPHAAVPSLPLPLLALLIDARRCESARKTTM